MLYVQDLSASIDRLRKAQVRFRNDVETAPAAVRYSSKIPTAIPSSFISLPQLAKRPDSQNTAQSSLQNCEMNFQLSPGTQLPGGEGVCGPTKMQARAG